MDNNAINKTIDDARNLYLPTNADDWSKVACSIKNGDRIFWYYKDNLNDAEEKEYIRDERLYSGIVVILPDIEYSGGNLEGDNVIVVVDRYPTEKCYPITDWVALGKLVDNKELVEIYK